MGGRVPAASTSISVPGRRRLQRGGCVERHDPALVQERDPRATFRLVQVRRGHHDRQAAGKELRQQFPELTTRHGVDARRRFVEQEHVGPVDQRAGERQLLLHPTRQPIRAPRTERRQLGQGQQSIPLRSIAADAVDLCLERDVLVDRQVAVEREPLREVPDHPGDDGVILHRVPIAYPDPAPIRPEEPAREPNGRRLSGAVRADQPEHLPAPDLQADAIEGRQGAEALADVLEDDGIAGHLGISASTGMPVFRMP